LVFRAARVVPRDRVAERLHGSGSTAICTHTRPSHGWRAGRDDGAPYRRSLRGGNPRRSARGAVFADGPFDRRNGGGGDRDRTAKVRPTRGIRWFARYELPGGRRPPHPTRRSTPDGTV